MLATVAPPAPPAAALRPGPRLQRVRGEALVRFGPHGLADLRQVAPARMLFPAVEPGEFPLAVLVTTTGGLTGGDRLKVQVRVDPGASATLMPQAAEKLYRARPEDEATRIETHIAVGAGGRCEWLAQEAILFDRSRLRRSLEIDLDGDARILASEMIVLGREAMGETFAHGLIHDGWRVRRDGRLVWADTLHLDGEVAELAARPFGFGPARALLTLVYVGPDAARLLDLARTLMPAPEGGATCLDDILILRMAGADPRAVRETALRASQTLRSIAFGLSPNLPSLCYC